MTYIDYINQFWMLNEQEVFTLAEAKVYFFLLNIANRNNWKTPFPCSDALATGLIGVTTNTFKTARAGLVSRGIINFESSENGKKRLCMYTFNCQFLTLKLTPKDTSTYQFRCQKLTGKLRKGKSNKKEIEYLKDKDNSLSQSAHAHVNVEDDVSPAETEHPLSHLLLQVRQSCSQWIELFCMNNQITTRDFNIMSDIFIKELENRGVKSKSIPDFQSHFASWFKIQKSNNNAKSQTTRPTTRSEARRQTNREQQQSILNEISQLDALYSPEGTVAADKDEVQ